MAEPLPAERGRGVEHRRLRLALIATSALAGLLVAPTLVFSALLPLVLAGSREQADPLYLVCAFGAPLLLAVTSIVARLASRRAAWAVFWVAILPLAPVIWAYGLIPTL